MNRTVGRVEHGRIVLPPEVRLPEGMRVLVEWAVDDLSETAPAPPLEREPWTEEDVQQEMEWARNWRWTSSSS